MTRVDLELLTDKNRLYVFTDSGREERVATISIHHVVANSYLISQIPDIRTHTDCSNLSGVAMSRPISYGEFRWFDSEMGEIEALDMRNVSDNFHYPIASEHKYVTPGSLSLFLKRLYEKLFK